MAAAKKNARDRQISKIISGLTPRQRGNLSMRFAFPWRQKRSATTLVRKGLICNVRPSWDSDEGDVWSYSFTPLGLAVANEVRRREARRGGY